MTSRKVILYQYAANLFFVPVDVIRPFNGDAVCPFIQLFFDGKGDDLGKNELAAGFNECRVEHETESDVLAFFRFPAIATLSFTGSLALGNEGGKLPDGRLRFIAQLRQVVVRRVCFRQYN